MKIEKVHFNLLNCARAEACMGYNNEIYLRRKGKLIIEPAVENNENLQYAATIMKNIEGLGYSFSKDLIDLLKGKTKDELQAFYLETFPLLKKSVGAHVPYNLMYPNFPQQVMDMCESALYINAVIHYWSGGTLFPAYGKAERLPLFEDNKVTFIDVGNEEDFNKIFTNLMSSKTSISQTDKEDLIWFIKNNVGYGKYMPKEIPLKENAALIGKLILEESPLPSVNDVSLYFKTATDVLRLITSMSDGDISLASNTKFRSFKRKERRILLGLLENCGNMEEDMFRYKNKWIRVGERLHPSEFKAYPKTQEAFHKLRNNVKIETYGGQLAESVQINDFKTALMLLSKRPGEFARKLDHILRITDNANLVINTFKNVAVEVSTPVLLQVKEHFNQRNDNASDMRVFFPKGNVAKAYAVENTLPPIDEKHCKAVVKICENALIENYKQKDFLGNVYLSDEFKNYMVPFSQRSASKALKTIVRGSKLPIDDSTKTIRSFIWWKNGTHRTDIDLSAVMYDENWQYLEHVSYTNLKSNIYTACHSGDIVDAPNGASEFIDIDIASILKYGGRYVVINILSYTQQPYCDLPECFMGWMSREEPLSGEIYEPKTVQNKIDITADTKICIPMILDFVDKKIIWADMALKNNPNWYNNVEGNNKSIAITCKAITNLKKPNLYDLIHLHIKARGILCDNKDTADIIFDVADGITPFDTEVFMGEYI